jgi:hypothetical protein
MLVACVASAVLQSYTFTQVPHKNACIHRAKIISEMICICLVQRESATQSSLTAMQRTRTIRSTHASTNQPLLNGAAPMWPVTRAACMASCITARASLPQDTKGTLHHRALPPVHLPPGTWTVCAGSYHLAAQRVARPSTAGAQHVHRSTMRCGVAGMHICR